MTRAKTAHPILVSIAAPDRSARPVLRKAASLAKLYKAPLRIVHVLAIPQGALDRAGATIRDAARADLENRTAQLEKLAGMAELRGLEMSVTVRCDYPVQDALVREALDCHARMLVVQSRGHGRLARMFLSNIDWELIRNCPCPLWLSKSEKLNPRAPVLAAVDPLHAYAKPARLDDSIVAHAIEAAGARASRVVLCHAYAVLEPVLLDTPEAYWFALSAEEQRAGESTVERVIGRIQAAQGIPPGNVAVVRGDPAVQLPRLAKKYAAGVMVMGAVSRRGLKRIFIGNTAERVLDKLDCDVLVVKPRSFKSPVARLTYRSRAQRPRRHSSLSRRKQSGGGVPYVVH